MRGFYRLQRKYGCQLVPLLLIATVFVIPISPTFKSILIVSSLIGILVTPDYRQTLLLALSEPWSIAALAVFSIVVLACFWGTAVPTTRLIFIEKYSKLLFLPIFAAGFRHRLVRQSGIYAFLLAMMLTSLLSLTLFRASDDPGFIFHNHIVTGFMMAFAAYLSGLLGLRAAKLLRLFFFSLFILFSYDILFLNPGRTGYVIYFILILCLLFQYTPKKYLLLGLFGFATLFSFFSWQSDVLKKGVHEVMSDWSKYQQGKKESSVGYRLSFHQFAKTLFLERPCFGQGTGGFSYAFQHINQNAQWKNLLDPHSQYWLVAAELGCVGLFALIIFFVTLLRVASRLHEMKAIFLAMLLAFVLSNFSDSLLLYSAVGYLFVVFSGLCLGELFDCPYTLKIKVNIQKPFGIQVIKT